MKFMCLYALGIGGAAVWRLRVTQAGKPDAEPDEIQKDIERVGAAGWLQLLMTDIPVEHGVQRLTGYAIVDDDGIQYGGCVVDGV